MKPPTKTFRYDIGHRRPDGKFNIWKRMVTEPSDHWLAPDRRPWVIVYVADSFTNALDWIRTQPGQSFKPRENQT